MNPIELPDTRARLARRLPLRSGGDRPRWQDEVRALAEERNAVILAHNYQVPEVQDVADFVGDSLGLSRQAADTDADVIAFCGVHFMAETASILSPDKTVLLPDLDAGCSLADSITADAAARLEGQAPGRDRRHVREHDGRGEGGDRLLLHVVERGPGGRAHLPRARPRHRDPVRPGHVARRVRRARRPASGCTSGTASATCTRASGPADIRRCAAHPDAEFLIHPECGCTTPVMEYVAAGDVDPERTHMLSTGGMLELRARAPTADTFIVATETGMLHPLEKENPGQGVHPGQPRGGLPVHEDDHAAEAARRPARPEAAW